ncbi:MAG TPA: ATP synthase F1 subunit gamma [Myxococcales bacterium]|nr:ATP synthase F1 subunit gamma [Myxococcales bacterium]
MHSLREIRRRVRSITATAQITRAMQMVAASKMRQAQDAANGGMRFARLLYRIQREATHWAGDIQHPLLEVRPVGKRAVILVGADKGLCGPLNSNLFRVAARFDPATTLFVTAGRRAAQFVARTGRQLTAEFAYGDSPTYPDAEAIAHFASDLFVKHEVDEVKVVGTRFVNTLVQEPVCVEFLPVGRITGVEMMGPDWERALEADTSGCVFEPNAEEVLAYLLSRSLTLFIYQVLLAAKASEQSARMVSMKNATDSAEGLIKDLTREYNKLRQGNITKELLEIAGGQSD